MSPTPDGTPSKPPPNTVTLPGWLTVQRLQSVALVATICVVGWLLAARKETPAPTDRPPATGRIDPGRADPSTPPKPGARPVLVLAASEARANFGPSFAAVGEQIRSGELTTQDAILKALGRNTAEFNSTLSAAIRDRCSPSGDVSDKDGLADVFQQVGQAFPPGSGAK